ncbi:MAG: hypothetical protein LW817_05320 [Candidatus Caenarcaniphilales bacterium]|jgi:hypothetical protein|nr:hypothetical protein [Candidatus Caenarcaniphilales bacterium]
MSVKSPSSFNFQQGVISLNNFDISYKYQSDDILSHAILLSKLHAHEDNTVTPDLQFLSINISGICKHIDQLCSLFNEDEHRTNRENHVVEAVINRLNRPGFKAEGIGFEETDLTSFRKEFDLGDQQVNARQFPTDIINKFIDKCLQKLVDLANRLYKLASSRDLQENCLTIKNSLLKFHPQKINLLQKLFLVDAKI